MKIIKMDPSRPNFKVLKKIAVEIANGKIIVYPTDTLYGICTNPFNQEAVKRLFNIKKRELSKGLPILVDNLDTLKKVAFINEKTLNLVDRYWPGALTLILKKTDYLPEYLTGGMGTIAVRMPACKLTLKLITLCGGILIGTSANLSGSLNQPKSVEDVIKELDKNIDYILDSGETPHSKPSTIINMVDETPTVTRQGVISKSDLEKILIFNEKKT